MQFKEIDDALKPENVFLIEKSDLNAGFGEGLIFAGFENLDEENIRELALTNLQNNLGTLVHPFDVAIDDDLVALDKRIKYFGGYQADLNYKKQNFTNLEEGIKNSEIKIVVPKEAVDLVRRFEEDVKERPYLFTNPEKSSKILRQKIYSIYQKSMNKI